MGARKGLVVGCVVGACVLLMAIRGLLVWWSGSREIGKETEGGERVEFHRRDRERTESQERWLVLPLVAGE